MPTFSTAEEPIFLVTDLSGRGGTYNANQSDLVNNPDEHEDDDEFLEWVFDAEIGDRYTEFNDRTYTRVS